MKRRRSSALTLSRCEFLRHARPRAGLRQSDDDRSALAHASSGSCERPSGPTSRVGSAGSRQRQRSRRLQRHPERRRHRRLRGHRQQEPQRMQPGHVPQQDVYLALYDDVAGIGQQRQLPLYGFAQFRLTGLRVPIRAAAAPPPAARPLPLRPLRQVRRHRRPRRTPNLGASASPSSAKGQEHMIRRQKLIGIVASVLLAAVGTGLLVAYRPQRREPGPGGGEDRRRAGGRCHHPQGNQGRGHRRQPEDGAGPGQSSPPRRPWPPPPPWPARWPPSTCCPASSW